MPGAARVKALFEALWRGGLKAAPLPAILVVIALVPVTVQGSDVSGTAVGEGETTPAAEAEFPAVAEALPRRVAVFRAPRRSAGRIAVMPALRFDYRPTVFHVTGRVEDRAGVEWLRILVPGHRAGQLGWVQGASLRILRSAGPFEIVVSLRQRRLRLLRNGRQVYSAPVAIGTPRAPTPRGRFYITAAFAPADPFLGVWALETSAHSNLTDWPRGGIVGLHGTNAPELIGRRVSHGCIRLHNRDIRILKPRVRPGTPCVSSADPTLSEFLRSFGSFSERSRAAGAASTPPASSTLDTTRSSRTPRLRNLPGEVLARDRRRHSQLKPWGVPQTLGI